MADEEAKDNAAKQRIITHMNEDHGDSIIRFLEHYCHLSAWQASGGKMSGVDLSGMTFACGNSTHRIPFTPPLASYRETRERVVAMDHQCLAALRRSDITVSEFAPPVYPWSIAAYVTLATFVGYSQRWWFAPGGFVERVLGAGFARFSWNIQPWLIGMMVVIHGAELAWFVPNKLRRHSVNPRSPAFWLWIVFTFVEGQFAFARFNALVTRKREDRQKQKH